MNSISFYIARRYLLSKKGSTAVTFITWLAAVAMTVAVAAMFIIVSVFSGLEDINEQLISNLHPDLTITSTQGKTLKNPARVNELLKLDADIEAFSNIIEEKVYIRYNGKGDIGFLRGVDSAYNKVNPIQDKIFYGKYPSFDYVNEVLMEASLTNRLSLPVATDNDYAVLYMPKAGEGIISKESDIFNNKEVFVSGVFPGNDQLNNFIIGPIELSQQLLNLPKDAAYKTVIRLKNPDLAEEEKDRLLRQLGNGYDIKTKKEENAAFWKMINTEKIFIYLIFALVIFITTFNLAGAIIILQLDKKQQSKALFSMGFSKKDLRKTYFYTGVLITLTGIVFGLAIGTFVCIFQQETGFFMANSYMPFPVKIESKNYLLVSVLTCLFGLITSWIASKPRSMNFSR